MLLLHSHRKQWLWGRNGNDVDRLRPVGHLHEVGRTQQFVHGAARGNHVSQRVVVLERADATSVRRGCPFD